jgi:hypothetical protein
MNQTETATLLVYTSPLDPLAPAGKQWLQGARAGLNVCLKVIIIIITIIIIIVIIVIILGQRRICGILCGHGSRLLGCDCGCRR